MKNLFSLFAALFLFTSAAFAQKGVMTFTEKEFNFGKTEQGKPVSHEFVFKNTGTDPIVISNAAASCGCTQPTYSKEPVMPGKTGKVSVTFNAPVVGPANKTVTITSNAEGGQSVLVIKGDVLAPKAVAAPAPAAKKEAKGTR